MVRFEELSAGSGSDVNPLKSDAELQDLLKKLDSIKKYKKFQGWKTKFLDRLDQFLSQAGMGPAEKACTAFDDTLKDFVKRANKVQDFVEKGDLGESKKTVKATTALNEMCKHLTKLVEDVERLIPFNSKEEKQRRFTKFHLGAMLIRQGFHQYITMKAIEDALSAIGKELKNVADIQQLNLFDAYHTQVQRFCDVMADLNLYEIMMKCLEFAEEPEFEEPEVIKITVKTHDGKTMKLEVENNETILAIQEAIAPGCGIPVERQILKFDGEQLTVPGITLEEAGIENGAVLYVSPLMVPITVKTMDGKTIKVMADLGAPIMDIKKQIEDEAGVPAKNQKLFFKDAELKDDNKMAAQYGIKEGSELYMEPKKITVNVNMPDGKKVKVDIEPADSSDDIKKKIEAKTGMAAPRQVLKKDGDELPEGKTVKAMGIRDGDNLDVDIFKVPVTVNTWDGKKIELMVDPTDKLGDIKKELVKESGIPAANQRLSKDGKELGDDGKAAQDYGIEGGTVLDLEPKTIKVTVEMPDGKKIQVEIEPADTDDDIKKKIEAKTGMAVPRQVLKKDDVELPKGKTVKAMGIRDGDDLKVDIFKVPVTVNCYNGKTLEIMVDPTDKLGDIKKGLEKDSGVPAKNQRISMEGTELKDDNDTAKNYGIKGGSVLDLEPKKISVNIEMPDGKKIKIDIEPGDTDDDIKKKIEVETGMEVPRQVLSKDGDELPKGKTVRDLGIQDDDDLKVDIFKVPVTVRCYNGKTLEIMVDPYDKLGDIKKDIEDDAEVPADNQRISMDGKELKNDNNTAKSYGIKGGSVLDLEPKKINVSIEMPDGKKIKIDIEPDDTDDDIKKKIEAETGLELPRQVLSKDGDEVPKGKTVRDLGIQEGDDLKVDIFKVPVTVNTMDGKKIEIMVDPTDKLGDIKKQLEDEADIPADNQNLFQYGDLLDGDDKTAADHGIKEGSVLDLEPKKMSVTVEMPDGKEIKLDVTPADTADDIKQKIAKKTNMSPKRQVLSKDGSELPKNESCKDMGVRDGDKLKVDVFKIPITVSTMDGDTIEALIDPTDNIADIKKQLEDDAGIPADNQRLFLNGTELDDDKPAEDQGVKAGSNLDLEPKKIKVNVEMPDGKVVPVEITPRDTTDDIKKKIEDKTGMAAPRQVLSKDGEELPRGAKTVKEMGIREGDDLKVDVYRVPVTVRCMDGKIIKIMVDPTDKLGDIKKDLEEESGIAADNQRLFMEGDELPDDSKTAKDYGIRGGSELDLEPKTMKVNVTMPDGDKVEVEITPKDTSDDIKKKIEDKTGMEVPRQVVKHNGKELPNKGETVKHMGIQDGDDLDVDIFKIPVTVNTMDGKQVKAMIDPTDTLGDIKKQLEDDLGEPAENQKLFLDGKELKDDNKSAKDHGIKPGSELDMEPKKIKVNVTMPDGKKVPVDIEPRDTADDIKKKIENKTGMIVPRQVLKQNGSELPNGKTVKDMGIRDGDDLDVEVFKIPITVKCMDGRKVDALIDPTDALGDIKKQIEDDVGVPADNQRLYLNGKELADDNKSANDHGIKKGSELYMEPKNLKVKVTMPDGKKVDVDITPKDTDDDIKKKIEAKTGMIVPRQVLKKNGSELPKGQTVKDMGVQDGDDLEVEVFKIPIAVNCMDGRRVNALIDPTDALGDIKKQIEDDVGVPADNQRLYLNGKELADDTKPAKDHGIVAGSELDMEPKKMTLNVTMPDGKKVPVDISPKDTENDIKKKIEAKTGMSVPRQVVKHNGQELPKNGKTAKDMGLQDGDDLDVEVFKIPITIDTMDGKRVNALIDPTDSLGDIKKQIEDDVGVPASNQRLYMDGDELEDDNKSANDHGIKKGSELYMEPKKMTVNVSMPDGKKVSIDISPKDKDDDIKKKIEAKTGMAVPRQVVKHNGKELPKRGKTVKDMGIRDGDNLDVEVYKIPVVVNCMDGRRVNAMIDPTDKLWDIKKQIEDDVNVPASNQRLFLEGDELADDDKTATAHGIVSGSVLDMEPKKMQVNVKMPDGSKVPIEIQPKDTSDDIKRKIADKTGMAVPRQVVKHKGKELPTRGETVKKMGINDGDDLDVDIYKVPVTINCPDGKKIKHMVDPTDTLGDIKAQIADEAGIPPHNQKLFMGGEELRGDNVTAGDHGIKKGSVLDLEPKVIKVNVEMPEGNVVEVELAPNDTADGIKQKIADKTGLEVPRQVVKFKGRDLPLGGQTVKDMGIKDGDPLKVSLFKIPIKVKTWENKTVQLEVEPCDTIETVKKMLKRETGLEPKKQNLMYGEEQLKDNKKTCTACGIKKNSVLTLEPHDDPIIFVDIKCGTLFAVDRDVVIEKGILNPNQGNKLDFTEASKDSASKEKMKKVMMESKTLGVNPQVVVEGMEVEDYDIKEAEKVKSQWGVSLKKRDKNKKGEEFIFVDPKTGAVGELVRKKYIDYKFITPVVVRGKMETLQEAEKDALKYDRYIAEIRGIFHIKSAK